MKTREVMMGRLFKATFCFIILACGQDWIARYNGPDYLSDQATAIALDGSGHVIVTGASATIATHNDFTTVKYDQFGNQMWVVRYDNGNYDVACAVAVDRHDNIYVTGTSAGTSYNNYDWATVKYNSDGVEQWVARYNGPKDSLDEPYAMAVDTMGNIYVTGYCDMYFQSSSGDYLTIKYDSTGAEQWQARYDGTDQQGDRAQALCVDDAGNVHVTGVSNEQVTYCDITTIKYDTDGNQVWQVKYRGTYNDEGRAIAVDGLKNVYVTGQTFNSGTRDDYVTIKYDSTGVEQWVRFFGVLDAATDAVHAIAVDNAGNVYVTGEGASMTGYDYATVKYSTDGVEQWVRWYDSGTYESDEALAIAVSDSNDVYVTGRSYDIYDDYATVKYSDAGVEEWVARYDGTANLNDCALAVVTDSANNAYVTGYSGGFSSNYDYLTIKYLPEAPGVMEDPLRSSTGHHLLQVNPSLFKDKATIRCIGKLNTEGVKIAIYDAGGRLVKTLLLPAAMEWDGADEHGLQVPPGVYFLCLDAGTTREAIKVMRVK